MSNSVISDDIDDVLTSIQRLVAKDDTRSTRSETWRLRLTPDLRVSEAAQPEDNAEGLQVAEDRAQTEDDDVDALRARIARLEAVIAHQRRTIDGQDTSDTATADEDGQSALVDASTDGVPALQAVEPAAMRALVRDVLREELQGAMGERLTGNIRKLVRREVQQALAMRDLE